MQLGDAATWGGVLVALVVGIGGVVVGAIGLVIAKGARADAKTANLLAKEANDQAKAALIGDDVSWQLEWRGNPGHAEMVSRGHDFPTNARGSVIVDGEEQTFHVADSRDIAWGISLTFPKVAIALADEEAKLTGKVEEGYVWGDKHAEVHSVSWEVTWETKLGRTMPKEVRDLKDQGVIPGTTNR